jgi:hypothetical protein
VISTPTPSASSRRAAKKRASRVAGSSQWASSTGDQQRLGVRGRAEKREQRDGDGEAVVGGRRAERQRRAQRGGLLDGQPFAQVEQGADEREQARVRDLRLALEAAAAQDAEALGLVEHLREQGGLADPGLAGDRHGEAAPRPGGLEACPQRLELMLPSVQHAATLRPGEPFCQRLDVVAHEPRGEDERQAQQAVLADVGLGVQAIQVLGLRARPRLGAPERPAEQRVGPEAATRSSSWR